MNALGLSLLFRMGCTCAKESIDINDRRFYVRSRIGEGGFSYIDLVEDSRTRRLYALKRMSCHSKDDERVAMQEVEIMRSFNHPNLVPLEAHAMVAVGLHSKTLDITSEVFIIMPFYKRGSLQDRIEALSRRSEKMPEDQIWSYFLGVCEGVRAMHHFNPPYAHRDLKPANIMIGDNDTPVLMDLGSAAKARIEAHTSSEARALEDLAAERCSMLFRAPELFHVEVNSSIDERTDIWSLGCVLYAMAFLESPFEQVYQRGDSIALAVMGRNIKFPENSGYSRAIEETICWLMAVNPMERPFINQILDRVKAAGYTADNRV